MASSIPMDSLSIDRLLPVLDFLKPNSYLDALSLAVIIAGSSAHLLKGIAWGKQDPNYAQYFQRPQLQDNDDGALQKESRNVAQKLSETGKDLVIFWGSQSGTAESLANRLGRECHLRFGFNVLVADLSDYDAESIAEIPNSSLAIFIMSTYGEGDPSDNSSGIWDWIHGKSTVSLDNLRYMAFGLGNSNYKYYNRVIDVVIESLNSHGASMLMPVGKADDAEGGTEEDFLTWKESLFSTFKDHLHLHESEVSYIPTLQVQEDESLEPIDLYHGEPQAPSNTKSFLGCSPIRPLKLRSSKQLFHTDERHCLHMEFDLSENLDLHYKTGDHLAIWPMNPSDEVDLLLDKLGLSDRKHIPILIKSLDETVKVKIPSPTTIDAVFRHYLEICSPVSRETLKNLAQFAPNQAAKDFMTRLGHDKVVYGEFLSQNYLTTARVLQIASPNDAWSNLPLSFLIETLTSLQPRYYSISSSSVTKPRNPSITALVANDHLAHDDLAHDPLPTDARQVVHGLTTNYLLALANASSSAIHPYGLTYRLGGPNGVLDDSRVFAHIRKSKFKLPALGSCPLIMVGAGTGLAPFLGFLTERIRLMEIGKPVGEMLLFLGCRHPDEDFIYREEIESMEKAFNGKLRIVTAFSRVPGNAKVYGQGRVTEHRVDVLKLLEEGANLYICGRADMGKAVERAVCDGANHEKGWDEGTVLDWMRALKGRRKWQEDVWG